MLPSAHRHFRKKFWQQLGLLQLDHRSDSVGNVGREKTPGWSRSANTRDTLRLVVESVQLDELLPELLEKMVMVPMEVLSVLEHVCSIFFTLR